MRSFAITIFLILFFGLFGFSTVNAQTEITLEFTPDCPPGLPGGCPDDSVVSKDIGSYIKRIYQFGVGISGVLAVGMIVAGAIYYSISAGSPDKQNDAKSMITSALWGVALLLGSFLILNTINPQIVKLEPPGGALPTTCGAGERPGIDCLPVPSSALSRACDDIENPEPGENCLPACVGNERACGPGEGTETGCTKCAYAIPESELCPEKFFERSTSPRCGPGETGPKQNCYCTPEVTNFTGNIAKPTYVGETPLENQTYWQHPFYLKNGEPADAECLIYATTKEDGNVCSLISKGGGCIPKPKFVRDYVACK